MLWVRGHYLANRSRATAAGSVPVVDATRQAFIDSLLSMLRTDRLTEDEFDLRWKAAVLARSLVELNCLRDEADSDEERDEDPDD